MKLLFCILAMYITLLPGLPCRDSEEGCREERQAQNNNRNAEDHKENQDCSPFCACTCCHVSNNIISFTPFTTTLPSPLLPAFKWPSQEGDTHDRAASIWQPPRTV